LVQTATRLGVATAFTRFLYGLLCVGIPRHGKPL
jgi:hypothetical protein